MLTDIGWCYMKPTDHAWCWLILIDANWCWLMLIDADCFWLKLIWTDWCWLMLINADWCWLMLIDADWCWLMLIDAQIRFNQVFFYRSVPPKLLRSLFRFHSQAILIFLPLYSLLCVFGVWCIGGYLGLFIMSGLCPWWVGILWK